MSDINNISRLEQVRRMFGAEDDSVMIEFLMGFLEAKGLAEEFIDTYVGFSMDTDTSSDN